MVHGRRGRRRTRASGSWCRSRSAGGQSEHGTASGVADGDWRRRWRAGAEVPCVVAAWRAATAMTTQTRRSSRGSYSPTSCCCAPVCPCWRLRSSRVPPPWPPASGSGTRCPTTTKLQTRHRSRTACIRSTPAGHWNTRMTNGAWVDARLQRRRCSLDYVNRVRRYANAERETVSRDTSIMFYIV